MPPVRILAAAGTAVALAACAAKEPPPPPPPPPPVVEVVPFRPIPPAQAPYAMQIPTLDAAGQRLTINTGISQDEKLWHFRSAWNVAALNCMGPTYQPVLDGYGAFLKNNPKTLKAANDRIDAVYNKAHGGRVPGIKARESRMTMVYNFFTLPAARNRFCQTALDIATRFQIDPKQDATAFALGNFPLIERPFEEFFQAYEQYQRDSAAWDARYGAQYGASQPGYVAVQRALAARALPTVTSNPATLGTTSAPGAGTVVDQTTGALIPVVPVASGTSSTPIVQPIPSNAGANDSPRK